MLDSADIGEMLIGTRAAVGLFPRVEIDPADLTALLVEVLDARAALAHRMPAKTPKPTFTIHFFKPSGKWYTTEEVEFMPSRGLRDALKQMGRRMLGMTAVCVDGVIPELTVHLEPRVEVGSSPDGVASNCAGIDGGGI